MRFKRNPELRYGLKSIYVAPLVNVMLLFLMFFMIVSSFAPQSGAKVNLPKALTSDILEEDSLIISIFADNQMYVNGRRYTFAELKVLLKRFAAGGKTVLIKSDQKSSFGKVAEVWDACSKLGISRVRIAAYPE